MNAFLLSLGVAIALTLVAAFAVPFFIDWSGHRAFFEQRASEILGRPVEFNGALEVRLVPFPSLTASDVRIGGEADGARDGVDHVTIRAALAPLLSGELNISEMVLTRPRTSLVLDGDGRLSWGEATAERELPLSPEHTRLERFEIVDGAVSVHDARSGRRHELSGLNLTGSAGTLAGPFRVEGGGIMAERRHTLRIATGRLQQDRSMRFTASVVPADRPVTFDLDGALLFGGEAGLRYRGGVVVARPEVEGLDLPWRLEGDLTAAARDVVFERLAVNIGPEARRVTLGGHAEVDFDGPPRFRASLSARQLDLDRTFGGGPDEPVSPAKGMAALGELLAAGLPPAEGSVLVEVGSIVLSGNLVEGVEAELEAGEARWDITTLRASGPGRSEVRFSGGYDVAAPALEGELTVEAQQAAALANWLFGAEASVPGLGAVTGRMAASTRLRLEGGGIELSELTVETGETRSTAEIAYWPGEAGERASLVAQIEADRLSLDGLRRTPGRAPLAGLLALVGDTDLDVALEARSVSSGAMTFHDVTAVAALSEGTMRIDRLRVGDMQGARIDGYGTIRELATQPEGQAELEIAAQSFDGIVETLAALGLEGAAERVAARADALAPALLSLTLEAGPEGGEASRAAITVAGTAGGTELDFEMLFTGRVDRLAEGDFHVALETANPDSRQLVRQLGLRPPTGEESGPGSIVLTARGRPDSAMPFELDMVGLGVTGRAAGDIRFAQGGGREVSGRFDLAVPDPHALVEAAGIALPAGPAGPVSVAGSVSAVDEIWRFADLEVDAGRARMGGALAFDFGDEATVVDGALEVAGLDLPWMLALLLGPEALAPPPQPVSYGDPAWSQTAFTPLDTAGWRGRLHLTAPHLGLGGGLALSGAALDLRFAPGRFRLETLEGGMLGGRFAGDLDIAVHEGSLQVDGRAELTRARLEEIVWRSAGRPLASGTASLSAEIAGGGRSMLAVMSTLSGNGSLRVEDGVIRRLNPFAFDQIVRAADAGMELEEQEVARVFAGHLDAGSLRFAQAEGAFSLAAGVARLRNVRLDAAELDSFASATVDVPTLGLDSEWTLRVDAPGADGRTREVGIVFAGPLAAPGRELDVNPLLGYLTVRAFEQEVERLEELQAEIDARAWLGRELLRFGRESRRFRAEREERQRRRAEEAAARERAAEEEAQRLEAEEEEVRRLEAEEAAREPADAEAPTDPSRELERLIQDALRGFDNPAADNPSTDNPSTDNPTNSPPPPDGAATGGNGQPINILPARPRGGQPPAPPQRQPGQPLQLDPSLPVR